MNSSESFWALDRQLLHQWGNDMVAEMGYLELLQSEPLRASTKQIVRKLDSVAQVHKMHVELYRRALVIYRAQPEQKSRVADMRQGLLVAEKVAQSFVKFSFDLSMQRTAGVVLDQTLLNNILIFTTLLICHELQPSHGKVLVRTRRRANYISTVFELTAKGPLNRVGILQNALEFLHTTFKQKEGAMQLRTKGQSIRIFIRLPISKQLKLI